jgi:hypothetical protein
VDEIEDVARVPAQAVQLDHEEDIGRTKEVDDYEPADAKHVFRYDQAVTEARRLRGGQDSSGDVTKPVTVSEALRAYEADLRARAANPYNAERGRPEVAGSRRL